MAKGFYQNGSDGEGRELGVVFFFQAEDGIRDAQESRGLGDVYKRQISNVVVDGKPIGDLGNAEALWHTDMSYNPVPPIASALYSLEIPPVGGATGFCNMYLAYETLPADLKARATTLVCVCLL